MWASKHLKGKTVEWNQSGLWREADRGKESKEPAESYWKPVF